MSQPQTSPNTGTVDTADLVVVGGGIAGLGVAWRAAQRGMTVQVVDDHLGEGASHVGAGMLAPVTEVVYGEERLLELNVESAGRWPAFAEELEDASGREVGYRTEGTLVVALDADDNRVLGDLFAFQRELGLEAQRLHSRECRVLEPALAPRVRGGIHVTGDHQVDNRAVTAALLVAAARAGAAHRQARVASIDIDGGKVRGVELDDGASIVCNTVVLAAGAWSAELPGLPDEARPPVRPVKGQIVRLRGPADDPLLTRTVRGVVEGSPVYLVPRADGRVVVGATVEEQGFDTTVTGGGVRELLDDAFALVPGVTELELEEASAGLRPGTPDNAPILGPSVVDGLVMATGHHRNGFLLLPVTADAIAGYVATGEVPDVIAPFSPQRFVGEGAAA